MSKRLRISSDDLLLGVAVWMCTLPLLALIALPRSGLPVAGSAAILGLIPALVASCIVVQRYGQKL